MQPIVKFILTKASISITLHTLARYWPLSLGGIVLFDPIVIQGSGEIAFLVKHCCKPTPYSPLLRANLSTLQLEAFQGGHILESNYLKTEQWLHTESWICKVWKLMWANHIPISRLVADVSTQFTYDSSITIHLALNGEFTTSELCSINLCHMSKGIYL